ncbi:uncharacterized protein LOC134209083 [Armigeres subalbatus]|uniref:uncharacterized protein LOC134209083 n=1 Tax=Armigeres subalbatus TaxID=124917 RepID=UPI002ED37B34
MCSEANIRNTLAFLFPENAAQPSLADMSRFVKSITGDKSQMETAYKISDEKSVFIRFKTEDAMQFSLENNSKILPFHYTNGKEVLVRMSVAGNSRYVRVYDLPPEISDRDVSSVMSKFGKIKRTIRERFPAEYQLDMFTGVRGIYMDVEQDIPEVLYFHNRKGRVHYEGMKVKCFSCKSETHKKKVCPILQQKRDAKQQQQQPIVNNTTLLAGMKEIETISGLCDSDPSGGKQRDMELMQKVKKTKKKRQQPSESETVEAVNPSTSEKDKNPVSHSSDPPLEKRRFRVPTYDWIDDEREREQIIADDKTRIAAAYNISVDQVEVYHD